MTTEIIKSQISLDGDLCKMDTSVKRTPNVVPTFLYLNLLPIRCTSLLDGNLVPLPKVSFLEELTVNILKDFKRTGSRFSACSLVQLLLSNLLLILSVNNPTHMYLSDLRVYFKVELYFRLT